jgi:hypothetical protein
MKSRFTKILSETNNLKSSLPNKLTSLLHTLKVNLKSLKPPQLIALVVILVGVIAGIFLVQQQQLFRKKAADGLPDIYFHPSSMNIEPGSTNQSVDIFMNTYTANVAATVLEISFDPQYLEVISLMPAESLPVVLQTSLTESSATLTIGSPPESPLNGTVKIATVIFNVRQTPISTQITFTGNTQVAAIESTGNVLGVANPATITIGSAPTATPPPTSGDNLVRNHSFEDGVTNWLRHTNGGDVSLGTDSSAVDGASSAKLTVNQPGTSLQLYQHSLNLEPNTTYSLSFSAKSSTGHDLSVYVHEHDEDYTNYGLGNYVANLSSSWQTFSTQFTTKGFSSTVNDGRLRFWFGPYDEAGDIYNIDNVVLTKGTTAPPEPTPTEPPATPTPTPTPTQSPHPNLLSNPSFESGKDKWRKHSNGRMSFTVGSPGTDGNNAAILSISNPGSSVQLYQSSIDLEPNTKYFLSFDAKSNSGHDLSVYIHKHRKPYTNYGLANLEVNLTNSWETFTTEFTTKGFDSSVTDARLRFWLAPYDAAGDKYYIDNVVLRKAN